MKRLMMLVILMLLMAACTPVPKTTPTDPSATKSPSATSIESGEDTPVSSPTITPTVNPFGDEVSFAPDQSYNGLTLSTGGDADVEIIEAPDTNNPALRSGNGAALSADDGNNDPDYYIRFQVDDSFLYAGSPSSRIVFIIEYLDEGFDTFNIQYDALSGGPQGNGQFKDSPAVYKSGTGEFITVEIPICDANFANRDGNADFRIGDSGDGADTFRSIAVRRVVDQPGPIEINVDSCGANPFDDQPDSDAIQSCISQTCSSDTILFTSGVDTPEYQGYLIDKTIFLVHPSPKSGLTFSSTDENNHALLKASDDLQGFVVHLSARSLVNARGEIDNITIQHLDIDGNRAERICTGPLLPGQQTALGEGQNDNWGSWLQECSPDEPGDSWCNPGVLYLSGGVDHSDPQQDYEGKPDLWSTGMVVQDVTLSNAECGTAFFFEGADYRIDSVKVDAAGEHVHAPGCVMTDPDDPIGGWADGITFVGPAHQLTNNLIMDPSDVGIVTFGGRDILIANNTIQARPGNHGMFVGIAIAPNTLGLISGLRVTENQVINEADPACGGIHMGINLGVHTYANGCMGNPSPATYGIAEDCTLSSPAPEGALCNTDTYCRTWGHVPADGTIELSNNTVTGAQVSYVISGLDILGELILSGNESVDPQLVDWEGDAYCVTIDGVLLEPWGALDFVAFNPAVEGWLEQNIECAR